MSDDLIKRARLALNDMQGRVDASKLGMFQQCIDRIAELEAQLAEAKEALGYMVNHAGQLERDHGIYWEATEIARAALAKMKNPSPAP